MIGPGEVGPTSALDRGAGSTAKTAAMKEAAAAAIATAPRHDRLRGAVTGCRDRAVTIAPLRRRGEAGTSGRWAESGGLRHFGRRARGQLERTGLSATVLRRPIPRELGARADA